MFDRFTISGAFPPGVFFFKVTLGGSCPCRGFAWNAGAKMKNRASHPGPFPREDDGDEPTIYVPKDVRRAEKRRRTDPAEPTAATAKRPHPTGDPADAISVE